MVPDSFAHFLECMCVGPSMCYMYSSSDVGQMRLNTERISRNLVYLSCSGPEELIPEKSLAHYPSSLWKDLLSPWRVSPLPFPVPSINSYLLLWATYLKSFWLVLKNWSLKGGGIFKLPKFFTFNKWRRNTNSNSY